MNIPIAIGFLMVVSHIAIILWDIEKSKEENRKIRNLLKEHGII